jgi:hypothetical protein
MAGCWKRQLGGRNLGEAKPEDNHEFQQLPFLAKPYSLLKVEPS